MATHSSVLAWRIPGTGESGGLPSMGSHRVGHNLSDLAAVATVLTVKMHCILLNLILGVDINWLSHVKSWTTYCCARNPCPLSQWCYLTISSSASPFSFCLQSFPARNNKVHIKTRTMQLYSIMYLHFPPKQNVWSFYSSIILNTTQLILPHLSRHPENAASPKLAITLLLQKSCFLGTSQMVLEK